MPTYAYKCLDCEHRFHMVNVTVAKRDEFKPHCRNCASPNTKRIISAGISFSFKEGMSAESSKPAGYWDNAERVRVANLEKRRKEKEEKLRYDPKEQARVAVKQAREIAAASESD